MRISKKLVICWFKDSRWDNMKYLVSTMYRFGRLGISITNKGE